MRNLVKMFAERHGNADRYDSLHGLTVLQYTLCTHVYTCRDGSESSGPGQQCLTQ